MIDKKECKGIFSGIPTSFKENGDFDQDVFRKNIRKMVSAGVQGFQTSGMSGEGYTLTLEEHRNITQILVEETEGKCISMPGCMASSTREAISRVKIAQECGADLAMIVLPHHYPVRNKKEVLRFFKEISSACPNIGLVHYNAISLQGVKLIGKDYKVLAEEIPNLIGTKQNVSDFDLWLDITTSTPDLAHIHIDNLFVPCLMFGGQGVDSILVNMFPKYALKLYEICLSRQWDKAIGMQSDIRKLWRELGKIVPYGGKYATCAVDDIYQKAAGFIEVTNPRSPYLSVPDEFIPSLKEVLEKFIQN